MAQQAAIDSVNYHEIAEHWIEEIAEEEPDETPEEAEA